MKIGYPGYFTFKGMLGEFAAFAFLLSLYEMFHPGWRRVFGFIIVVTSIYLVIVSESKGSLGCAVLAAILATLVLFVGKKMRVSPAIVLLPLPICYAVLSIDGRRQSCQSYIMVYISQLYSKWSYISFGISSNLRSQKDRCWAGDTDPFGSSDPTLPYLLMPEAGSGRCHLLTTAIWTRCWTPDTLVLFCS